MNEFEKRDAQMLRPILYTKLGAIGVDQAELTNATVDLSNNLAREIEAKCQEAAARGPDWRVAVSPLERDGMSFVHKFAFIEGPWISPEFSGWMVCGPFTSSA